MLVGRGRGHVSRDRNEQLRRPVDPNYVTPLENIASKIAVLEVNSVAALKEIQNDIAKYCVTVDKLKLLVSDLHERSLLNRKFGAKCVVALATQSQLTVDGKKLRTILMQNVQTEFEDRENLRHHTMNRFLNSCAFLGEVFRNIRLANNAPISVLAGALIECCKLLITGSEEEIELCVQQLAYNGKLLKQTNDKELKELQVSTRAACMAGLVDSRCLCWLHLACDLDRHNYESLSSEFHELYKEKLGKEMVGTILELLSMPEPVMVTDEAHDLMALNGLEISTRPDSSTSQTPPVSPAQTSPVPPKPTTTRSDEGHGSSRRIKGNENGSGENMSVWRPALAPPLEARTTNNNPSGNASKNPQGGQNVGSGRFGGRERRNDPRNDPANWLPRNEPIPEKDRSIWGSEQRRGGNYGHDDRFDKEDGHYNQREQREPRKSQSKGDNWRASNGTGGRPPLPDVTCEESWD